MQTGFELKKRKDFVKVAKVGAKVVRHSLILQAALNLSSAHADYRLGFVATKKLGKAHIRNRVKRRLRACARDVFKDKTLKTADYVLIGRYSTAEIDFKELKSDMLFSLKRINKELCSDEKNTDTPC